MADALDFRALFDCISDGVVVLDRDWRYRYVNRSGAALLGHTPQSLAGQRYHDLFPEAVGLPFHRAYERALATQEPAVFELYHEPWARWFENRVYPSADGLVILFSDVTDRRRSEQALELSEQRFRSLVETAAEAVWWADPNGEVVRDMPSWERFTGVPVEATGNGTGWLAAIHPEDRERTLAAWRAAVATGEPYAVEHRVRRHDGRWRQMAARAVPVRDAAGAVREWVGAHTDVTEQRRLEEQFLQAQKMEAVGQLAGGIAHDFNNLLTAIRASADLSLVALRDAALTLPHSPHLDVVSADLAEIRRATSRAADLTRQLLAFSRRQLLDPRPVAINDVVTQAMPLVRRLVSADIRIDSLLQAGAGTVTVDARQLEQVLMNLVVNARDAVRGAPAPRITVATLDVVIESAERWGAAASGAGDPREALLPAGVTAARPGLLPGAYAVLVVHDNGGGMDADTQARVFEPFFTTKPVGEGTGLGLATVYGIVKQSGGFVYLDSAPERGTMCSVYLPAATGVDAGGAAGPAATPAEAAGAPAPADAVGTVLLVEDEAAVRAALGRLLERAGHRVLEARHGNEALAIWADRRDEVDLVFTDVVMPELGGLALVDRLRADRPEVPVVFMSGHSERGAPAHAPLGAHTEWLTKPFQSATMLRAVAALLRAARGRGGGAGG